MIKIIEFLFFRWKKEILKIGSEVVTRVGYIDNKTWNEKWDYIDYKYINKFDGSIKIKRKYI